MRFAVLLAAAVLTAACQPAPAAPSPELGTPGSSPGAATATSTPRVTASAAATGTPPPALPTTAPRPTPTSPPTPLATTVPATSTPAAAPSPTSVPRSPAACPAPVQGVPSGGAGPYFHKVYRASSLDGFAFTLENQLLLDHASVPDAVVRADGSVWVYYVNGVGGQHGIWAAKVNAAGALEVQGCILIDGRFNGNAVDPDVVRLPDGRLRLYYFEGWFTTRQPPGDPPHPIFSAVSDDGLHFTREAQLLSAQGITDPSVIQLPDGTWLMALSQVNRTLLASSADNTAYTLTGVSVSQGVVPELALLPDGRVRLFVTGGGGSQSSVSADGGRTWTAEPGTRIAGQPGRITADPSLIRVADGSWVLYYKVQ